MLDVIKNFLLSSSESNRRWFWSGKKLEIETKKFIIIIQKLFYVEDDERMNIMLIHIGSRIDVNFGFLVEPETVGAKLIKGVLTQGLIRRK